MAILHAMATKSTSENKSAEAGMENKSLEQTTVDGAVQDTVMGVLEEEPPEANSRGNVHVVIAHPIEAGRVKDKELKPGEKVSVPRDRAIQLVAAGAAAYVE